MTLPNLVYVGADKAGSSWYFEVFKRHPDVFVTESKDLYFFDRYFERGIGWYKSRFSGAESHHKYVCELSHDYLYSDTALHRMATVIPNAHLLISVRRPVDRMISEFKYLRRKGILGPNEDIASALHKYPEAMIDRGLYADRVEMLRTLPAFERSRHGLRRP